jgi:light-regulated signal transduction histidine kinase (bacteriophytochrome)
VTRDLTERKAAEDKLLQYAHRLETQNTELQQFAYAAAHDLKEPLRKIMMYYSAISGEGVASLSAKQQQYLSRSANAAARMHGLIDDMLAFTRLTQPGQVLEPVDLDSLLTEIVESLKDNIDAAGARISIAPLSSVMGIPFQLRQVFINLLGNALKYHHPDRLPSIDLFAQTLEKEAGNGAQRQIFHRITIRDNGIGFDEDQRERIFNLYERLHGRNEFEGTGIGLAICRKIMQTHQGAVTATGKIGLGAEFHLDFPSDIT